MKVTIAKINKTKSWFFENINKFDNQPDSSRKNGGGETQSNKTINEK